MKEYLTKSGEGVIIEYSAPAGTDTLIYTITDIDLDEVLYTEEAEYDGEIEAYLLSIPAEFCVYDRKLRIDLEIIDYGTAGEASGSYTTDHINASLVRPYISIEEIAEELGLTITPFPDSVSDVTAATLERWERQARMFINSKIDDKIRLQYKTVTVVGEDTDVLYIGERIESFDKIIKDDEVVFDSQNDIDLLTYDLEVSKSKLQIKPIASGMNIDEGKAMSVVYDPGFFERGSIYTVRGEFGWREVPEQIREATLIMVDDMRCNDWSYRNKGLKSIKNDGFDIQYNDVAFAGTGNLLVDSLIAEFKGWRFFSI